VKIGIFTVLMSDKPFEEALDYFKELGLEAVEIGCGGYPGDAHCKPAELLEDDAKRKAFLKAIEKRDLVISALSVHGNPIHPNKEIAKKFLEDQHKTIELAGKLGVERVITFSGCPGDHPGAKYPNWVTCPWPPDFLEILKYQWEEVAIPFWKEEVAFAKKHGVKMICLEMHPGFIVYNPETLLKLREAVGEEIGANFDPSHLFWQGIDPVAAIRQLKGAIYHFHAKDTKVDPINTSVNGVLDTKPYTEEIKRSWIFRTVGYGHNFDVWKDIVSNLRLVGYDWVLSIEHEDSLMSQTEGLRKAVDFLKQVVIQEPPPKVWWA
jgi:sugar phosphate isomerase/epimerase